MPGLTDAKNAVDLLRVLASSIPAITKHAKDLQSKYFGLKRLEPIVEKRRNTLAGIALLDYQDDSNFPVFQFEGFVARLLAKQHWAPSELIPLETIDRSLAWKPERIPPVILSKGLANRLETELGRRSDNLQIYRLYDVLPVPNAFPTLVFTLDRYHSYVESCEALLWETAEAAVSLFTENREINAQDLVKLQEKLRLRKMTNPYTYRSRSIGVGVNTITILGFKNEPPIFLMHERRNKVRPDISKTKITLRPSKLTEAIDSFHVVPAGTFQPLSEEDVFHNVDFSIRRNVLREFGEELLDKEDLMLQHRALHPDYPFKEDPELRGLLDLFETGNSSQWLLGCAIDPLSLKLEIMTLLLLNGDETRQRIRQFHDSWEGSYKLQTLSRPNLAQAIDREDILPAGAGALIQCLRHYDAIIDRLNDLVNANPLGSTKSTVPSSNRF